MPVVALEVAEATPDDRDPETSLQQTALRAEVRAAIASLPEHQRAVVVLYYLTGRSQAEIAAFLGISEGAVKMRRFRALQHLRELLGPEQERDDP